MLYRTNWKTKNSTYPAGFNCASHNSTDWHNNKIWALASNVLYPIIWENILKMKTNYVILCHRYCSIEPSQPFKSEHLEWTNTFKLPSYWRVKCLPYGKPHWRIKFKSDGKLLYWVLINTCKTKRLYQNHA